MMQPMLGEVVECESVSLGVPDSYLGSSTGLLITLNCGSHERWIPRLGVELP